MASKRYIKKRRSPLTIPFLVTLSILAALTAFLVFRPATQETPTPDLPPWRAMRIVLDPGHGGTDPGCVFEEIWESDINLSIALQIKPLLEAAGHEVIMTREEDVFVSLEDRVLLAEGMDFLISIHQNALESDTVTHGIETWYNTVQHPSNKTLAYHLQASLIDHTAAKDRGLKPDTQLILLQGVRVPACLIETGFLSCPEERDLLLSDVYQSLLAQGVAEGVLAYLEAAL